VRLAPLTAAVDGFLRAMAEHEWPDLTMPRIAHE